AAKTTTRPDMQRGNLCLTRICEADMDVRDVCSRRVLAVTFHIEVGSEQSTDQVALVEQVGDEYGAMGHLTICYGPIPFGVPQQVVEAHIQDYVMHAIHMVAGVTVDDMANKV